MKMLFHSLDLKFAADDPRARDVEVMSQKMDLLNRIVEQVLDFARSTEPKLASVNLNSLIEDLGLLTRHKLKNQNIELVQQLDPNLPPLLADATQLEQAFLNIALNAVEAMPVGGKLTIVTRTTSLPGTSAPSQVVIEFTDTGKGLTEEQCKRAFTSLLSTTKSTGTGLGLAIVSRVVETHRGEVQIKSSPGGGTTVTILLPC
jgi:signal transduction histidine kinase